MSFWIFPSYSSGSRPLMSAVGHSPRLTPLGVEHVHLLAQLLVTFQKFDCLDNRNTIWSAKLVQQPAPAGKRPA